MVADPGTDRKLAAVRCERQADESAGAYP